MNVPKYTKITDIQADVISDSGSEDTATLKSVKKDTPKKTPVFKLATPKNAKKAATPKKACDNPTEFQCKTSSLFLILPDIVQQQRQVWSH